MKGFSVLFGVAVLMLLFASSVSALPGVARVYVDKSLVLENLNHSDRFNNSEVAYSVHLIARQYPGGASSVHVLDREARFSHGPFSKQRIMVYPGGRVDVYAKGWSTEELQYQLDLELHLIQDHYAFASRGWSAVKHPVSS